MVSKLTTMSTHLGQLKVGDRIPWRLDRNGEPQWLTVTEVLSDTSYLVRYPDGSLQTLIDTE
jgi:hypothetical protein